LYNITDFSKLGNDKGESTMSRVAQADLKTGTQSRNNAGYASWRGLNYRDNSIFYTVCTEENGDNYIVNIQTKGLGKSN
jgi:hypothetical protein